MACPQCEHCAKARRAKAAHRAEAPAPVTVRSVLPQLRPWDHVEYGSKITALVDWYDGWRIGTSAETDDAEVPSKIVDKREWVAGFLTGWNDAAPNRAWRQRHAKQV